MAFWVLGRQESLHGLFFALQQTRQGPTRVQETLQTFIEPVKKEWLTLSKVSSGGQLQPYLTLIPCTDLCRSYAGEMYKCFLYKCHGCPTSYHPVVMPLFLQFLPPVHSTNPIVFISESGVHTLSCSCNCSILNDLLNFQSISLYPFSLLRWQVPHTMSYLLLIDHELLPAQDWAESALCPLPTLSPVFGIE